MPRKIIEPKGSVTVGAYEVKTVKTFGDKCKDFFAGLFTIVIILGILAIIGAVAGGGNTKNQQKTSANQAVNRSS